MNILVKIFLTYPRGEADKASAGWLKENRLPEWHAVESQLSEGHVKLQVSLGDGLHFVAEALEGLLQLVPELPLRLLGSQVVPVMHVLVLAQVRGDLADLSVELHVPVLFLAEEDGVLKKGIKSLQMSQQKATLFVDFCFILQTSPSLMCHKRHKNTSYFFP